MRRIYGAACGRNRSPGPRRDCITSLRAASRTDNVSPVRKNAPSAVVSLLTRRAGELLHRVGLMSADIYVMAFPKSGGTWVRRLLSDLLPVHDHRAGRSSSGSVVHDHWPYSPALRPAVYVVRDGRDVVVSLYFHHVRDVTIGTPRAKHVHAFLVRTLGAGYDLDAVSANLPAFIRSLTEHPFGGILRASGNRRFKSWPAHVADWSHRPGVLHLRYEELLADTVGQVDGLCRWLGLDLLLEEVVAAVEHNSFGAITGRRPGQADPTAFARKGVAGDWRTYFTAEAAAEFDAFAGAALVELGYEPDRAWLSEPFSN
jgi:hypothetical protein